MTAAWKFPGNFSMHFAKNICISIQQKKLYFGIWIFLARYSLLHAIKNWVVVVINSFHGLFNVSSSNLHLGQFFIIFLRQKRMSGRNERHTRKMDVIPQSNSGYENTGDQLISVKKVYDNSVSAVLSKITALSAKLMAILEN